MNIEFIKTCEYEKYSDGEHKIVYFDKSLPREVVSLSPIEVLTTGEIVSDRNINYTIFGTDNRYKLISMRIYNSNVKVAEWAKDLDNEYKGITKNSLWIDKYVSYEPEYSDYLDNLTATGKINIIVDY